MRRGEVRGLSIPRPFVPTCLQKREVAMFRKLLLIGLLLAAAPAAAQAPPAPGP